MLKKFGYKICDKNYEKKNIKKYYLKNLEVNIMNKKFKIK